MEQLRTSLRPLVDSLVEEATFITTWIQDKPYEDTSIGMDIATIYAGNDYSAVITEKGNVYMWGVNEEKNSSILGNRGEQTEQKIPTLVYASGTGEGYLSDVVRMSPTSNGDHILIHANNGVVYAWGKNTSGQLGDRTYIDSNAPVVTGTMPLQFSEAQRQITLSLQYNKTGNLEINYPQVLMLVYGSNTAITDSFEWKSLDDSIATVARNPNDPKKAQVFAFREGETKVVVQNTVTGQATFARVIVTDGVTYPQLVLGEYTSTALKKNGPVWAWGDNSFRDAEGNITGVGKLGTGSQQTVLTAPVQLSHYKEYPTDTELKDFKDILRVSSGDSFAVAVDKAGAVYAWGDNSHGQLGYDPNALSYSAYPVKVHFPDTNAKFIAAAAGANHVLAVTEEGVVYAWGDNTYGQLGVGYRSNYEYTPSSMLGFTGADLDNVMDVAATVGTSAVLLTNGTVWTVGSNLHGELGNGWIPLPEMGMEDDQNYSTRLVRVDRSAVLEDNARTIDSEEIYNVNRIIGHGYNFALITRDKEVYTWGDNSDQQIGAISWRFADEDEDFTMYPDYALRPVKVMNSDSAGALQNVIDISIGGGESQSVQMVATTIEVTYTVINGIRTPVDWTFANYSWGSNEHYKAGKENEHDSLGNINKIPRASLIDVIAGMDLEDDAQFQAVAAGGSHTGVFDTNGVVYMWGNNEYGQLGNFAIYDGTPTINNGAVATRNPGQVDEERIAIYEVINEDGRREEIENSFYTVKSGDRSTERKFMGEYLYSFSVDKEVNEAKSAELVYYV